MLHEVLWYSCKHHSFGLNYLSSPRGILNGLKVVHGLLQQCVIDPLIECKKCEGKMKQIDIN